MQSLRGVLVPAGVMWSDHGKVNSSANDGTAACDQDDFAVGVPEIPDSSDARQRFWSVTSQPPCSSIPRLRSPPRWVPFAPVQAGTWFIASFLHVSFELSPQSWVKQYSAYGVFAVHCSKLDISLDSEPHICQIVKLLFKSRAAAATLVSLLINNPNSPLTLESFAILHDKDWRTVTLYHRVLWLPFIDQLYEHALDPADFRFLLGHAPPHPHVSVLDF